MKRHRSADLLVILALLIGTVCMKNEAFVPSRAAMTLLLTTTDVAAIVAAYGLPKLLARLADAIESDFCRWPEFDKMVRVASHSKAGCRQACSTIHGR